MHTNWAGNITYQPDEITVPASLDALQRAVANTPHLRAIGTRHTFSDITDAPVLVSLADLPGGVEFDSARRLALVPAGLTYATLGPTLHEAGFALPALASLPHISVAGAVATGTHGSGDAIGNLATPVRALHLITAEGDNVRIDAGHPDFRAMVVGLGAFGIVHALELALEPTFDVRQQVYEGASWDALEANLDAITGAATSVSLFTRYGDSIEQVWLIDRDTGAPLPDSLFGATAATQPRHPTGDLPPDNVTPQLDAPGPWHTRLPHFIPDAPPASGNEIQSEYLIPRQHAMAAIRAVRDIAPALAAVLMISEIRTIAADDLWLSPAHEQDVIGLHFTWHPRPDDILAVLPALEEALAPYDPRPHWGKLVARDHALIERYPRAAEVRSALDRWDPTGKFRNDWLRRVLGER